MLVSIIVPIYKVELYINDCLSSIYSQSYSEIEVVLVDDCSPDNSVEIAQSMMKKMQSKFPCVLVRHEENKGLSAARNTGVRASNGEYLFFLDSDDEIASDCIELMVRLISQLGKDLDFVVGGFDVKGVDYAYPILSGKEMHSGSQIIESFLANEWPVMACNKLIKKKLFIEKELWFEEGLLHEDELFSFKLGYFSSLMAITTSKTYIYKVRNTGSITSDKTIRNYESMIHINKYRYSVISEKLIGMLKSPVPMSFIIYTTFDFIRSVYQTTSFSDNQKYNLVKSQLIVFLKVLNLRKCLTIADYKRLLLIVYYKIKILLAYSVFSLLKF